MAVQLIQVKGGGGVENCLITFYAIERIDNVKLTGT